MSAAELLLRLRDLGVEVRGEGERLRLNAPAGVLTPALRSELSERKAEVLRFLERAARGAPRTAPPPLERVPRDGRLPLSFAQQRLWFLEQLQPGSPVYHIPAVFRLEGELSVPALTSALAGVAARHEALRTTFPAPDGEPVQAVAPPSSLSLPVVDLSGVEAEREVERRVRDEVRRPFDLARGPLLRVVLLRLSGQESVLVLVLHHIVADGWSVEVLLRELAALYQGECLPVLPVQYPDFACWQQQWLQGEVLEAELAYWRERLAGMPPALDLAPDRPRPQVQSGHGATRSVRIPDGLAADLGGLGRRLGATLFMTLLAGFQALLARRSGREDIPVGTPVAGRGRVEVEGLIGLFANTLVVRGDLAGDPPFAEHLARVRERVLEAFRHQEMPFEKLVEELRPERSLGRSPLFQVMLSLQSFPLTASAAGSGLRIRRLPAKAGNAKFDLHLALSDAGGGLAGGLEYDRELFDATTVEKMAGHLTALLAAAVGRPAARLSELPLLSDCERHQLLLEWNDRPGTPGKGGLLHERFAAQAERTPDAVALVCGAQRLSYRELNERTSRAASVLHAGPEDVVALEGERSPEMVIELLGILKAGAAWLPLDPRQPRERLREALTPRPPLPPLLAPSPGEGETAAYVLYTSGSTGQPKGVVVPHQAVAALADWAYETFSDQEMAGVLASTSIGFDLSVFELLVPLSRGGKVVLVEDALALLDLPEAGEVTLLNTVPSVLTELLRAGAVPPSVVTINLAGEPLPAPLARQVRQRLYNLYGPTEDTVYSTWERVEDDGAPAIGRPIRGSYARVFDSRMALVPAGVPGELYLGGLGLARGYRGRPDLTAERFVPDPFGESGARLYRTGDRVRFRADGRLEYLGRLDAQAKIRGVRIEPGEIEAALVRHPRVRAAAVLALTAGEDKVLAAFLAADPETSVRELRDFAAGLLPAAMVPGAFRLLPELPRTANGKVDRRALAALDLEEPEGRGFVPPEGELEQTVAEVWRQVLGRAEIGADDNFFELGGDSLKTIRVVMALRRKGVETTVRDLFRWQTVRDLARGLEHGNPLEAASQEDEPDSYELGPSQAWFFSQPWLHPDRWALVRGRHSPTALDPGLFRRTCGALLRRHTILNAVFPGSGLERRAVLRPPTDPPVEEHDLTGLPEAERRRFVNERAEVLVGSLRIAEGPLLRLALFRWGDGSSFVLFVCHHLVCDEISVEILTDDFLRLYRTCAEGGPEPPPARDLYRDHVLRLRRLRESGGLEPSLRFWRDALPGYLPRLPVDFRDALNLASRKERRTVALAPQATAGLERIARERFGTGLYALFFGVAARAVALWAGTDEAVLIEIHHGRDPEEGVDRAIGFFAAGAPFRVAAGAGAPVSAWIEDAAARLGSIPIARRVHYNALWREIPSCNFDPDCDRVIVNFFSSDGAGAPDAFQPGVEYTDILPNLVELSAVLAGGALRVHVLYSAAKLRRETAERLAVLLEEGFAAALV